MKSSSLSVLISSGGRSRERLVVEIEKDGDSIATVSIETGEVLVEFNHRISRSSDISLVGIEELLDALKYARDELTKTYGQPNS